MGRELDPLRHRSERGEIEERELKGALTEIRDRYRAELGDEAYDLVLYAGGEDNRVVVLWVVDASPAQAVGLQTGDILLSYAGERLFAKADLVRAVEAGGAGGTVPLVVLREGREHDLSVPAGRLGLRVNDTKGEPIPLPKVPSTPPP